MKFQNSTLSYMQSSPMFNKNMPTSILLPLFISQEFRLNEEESLLVCQLKQYQSKILLFNLPKPHTKLRTSKRMFVDYMPVSNQEQRCVCGLFQYSILFPTDKKSRRAAQVSSIFNSWQSTYMTCLQYPKEKNQADSTLPSFIEELTLLNPYLPLSERKIMSVSARIQYITSLMQMNRYSYEFQAASSFLMVWQSSKVLFNFLFSLTNQLMISS